MKKSVVILVLTAIVLISCFMPINEEIVFAVEDNRNPEIVVTSPEEGDVYTSKVIIKGHVKDDSQESGDNKGSLSSLSVTASSSPSHRGKIEIDSDGNYIMLTDFGRISKDKFTYTSGNKGFTVEIDTSDFSSRTMDIAIVAVDRNGNEARKNLQLQRSGGPYLKITESIYPSNGKIKIKGSLANSELQMKKYDEISSLRVSIRPLNIDKVLNIADGDTSVRFPGRLGDPYLIYNVDELHFTCNFELSDSEMHKPPTLDVTFIAEDKNGNTTQVEKSLSVADESPVITIASDGLSVERNYFYSANTTYMKNNVAQSFYAPAITGATAEHFDTLRFKGEVTVSKDAKLSTLKLKFEKGKNTSTTPIDLPQIRTGTINFDHPASLNNFPSSGTGNTIITLTAEDDAQRTASNIWVIQEDSTPPGLNNVTTTAINNGIRLSATIQDVGGTGVNFGTLDVLLDNSPASSVSKNESTNSFSVDVPPDSDNTQRAVTIRVKDIMGNLKDVTTPVLSGISIASDRTPNSAAWPGNTITLTATSSSTLKAEDFEATIAGQRATNVNVTPNPDTGITTLTATAVIPANYTTSPIPFEITGFSDKDGIPGIIRPITSTIGSSSSVTLYTGGPTLTLGNVNDLENAYIGLNGSFALTVTSNQPLNTAATPTPTPTVRISPGSQTPTITITQTSPFLSFTVNIDSFAGGNTDGRISVSISNITNANGITQSNTIANQNLNAWYYPGGTTLEDVEISHNGTEVVLTFTIGNSRVLEGDPTVVFTSTPSTPGAEAKTLTAAKDTSVQAPNYRYTHTIDAGSLTGSTVTSTVTVTDMAGNTGTGGGTLTFP